MTTVLEMNLRCLKIFGGAASLTGQNRKKDQKGIDDLLEILKIKEHIQLILNW